MPPPHLIPLSLQVLFLPLPWHLLFTYFTYTHFSLRFQRLRDSGADFRHFRYRFQRLRDSGTDFEHFRYRFQRLRDSGADLRHFRY